jgi:hypothetical protein
MNLRLLVFTACIALAAPAFAQAPRFELIKPSTADPRIKNADENNIVARPAVMDNAPLVVYLPGTGGTPEHVKTLLSVITGQGYRAIGLYYDDDPAVQQVCATVPNPECAGKFREMRIYGTGGSRAVSNPPQETIVSRLITLLKYLDAKYPAEHWGAFVGADGKPVWSRIVVSGLSQGAGMAAFIAKKEKDARVVCFSSPVDMLGGITGTQLAPWLTWPSATPPDRWYAERNSREPFNPGLIKSYPALGIPADHIKVFDHDLPPGRSAADPKAYHGINVLDAGYTPEWKFLFGTPADLH